MGLEERSERKSAMDDEHRVQFDLIRALHHAVEEGQDSATIELLLEQLIDYSEAHFLSEEFLMRLSNYDAYEDHVEDHRQLIESFRTVLQQYRSTGRRELIEQVAKSSMAFMARHIKTRDVHFANWQRR